MKVAYKHVAADGRFQFHRPDGTEVVVDGGGYSTDDPAEIAYLDSCPFVKRQGKQKAEED